MFLSMTTFLIGWNLFLSLAPNYHFYAVEGKNLGHYRSILDKSQVDSALDELELDVWNNLNKRPLNGFLGPNYITYKVSFVLILSMVYKNDLLHCRITPLYFYNFQFFLANTPTQCCFWIDFHIVKRSKKVLTFFLLSIYLKTYIYYSIR